MQLQMQLLPKCGKYHTHTLSVDGYLRDIIGMHALAEMSANKPYYAGIHLSILNTDVWQKQCFFCWKN